jgi:hypothetical protein
MGLAIVIALPYAFAPIYDFPEPGRFQGSAFLNPYRDLQGTTWQRANLHAHSRAWGGVTNGRQTGEDIVRAYREMGYTVAGVSDYQHIAALDGVPTIPLYEHGYNVTKRHQLAIGAHEVAWFDFPLWQSLSHEQFIIDRVGRTADLVALAHPTTRDAYTSDDLRVLSGYQLMEVVSGPHRIEEPWDAALSSGHAVWALANDDTHDLGDPARTAMAWNMIGAASNSTPDIVSALRSGRAYAVSRSPGGDAAAEILLQSVELHGGTLVVTSVGAPSTFTFVGQDGVVLKTTENTSTAEYTFGDKDTYIRTVIRSPRTAMYLNPVMRYDGVGLQQRAAAINVAGTWLLRGVFLIGSLALAVLYGKRRAPLPHVSPPQEVLSPETRKTA